MKTIGNMFWFLLGGGIISLLWFVAALLCFVTIIGIPLGIQCLKFAGFVLYPFGRSIEYSSKMGHFLVNILWIMLCGCDCFLLHRANLVHNHNRNTIWSAKYKIRTTGNYAIWS